MFVVAVMALHVAAHDVPVQLPPPQSVPEAWNVIEESSANVDKLMEAGLLRDVMFQLANLGGSVDYLQSNPPQQGDAAKVKASTQTLLTAASELIVAVRDRTEPF